MKVPINDTRDEDDVKTSINSFWKMKLRVASNYYLTHDMIMRNILPPQKYGYNNLIYYFLNVIVELQDSK